MKQIRMNKSVYYNNSKNTQIIELNNSQNNMCKINALFMQTILFLLLVFALSIQSVFAADTAATVFFKSGTVTANSSEHGLRHLEKDDSVYNKDEIDTADNGRAQLRFTDGGLVSLMPGSLFSVEEYLFDEADEDSSAVFGLLKGGLRTVTGAIGRVKHEQYELKTPVATLGIRGTEFTVVLQNADTLLVHVGRGKVVITNDSGSLEVHEGQNAIVTLGNAPQLTEQEPMFLATAVNGDDLSLEDEVNQDPHITDVLTDVPTTIDVSSGNVLVHYNLQPKVVGAEYLNSSASIGLFNVPLDQLVPAGAWDKHVYGSNAYLEWGGFSAISGNSDTSGSINGITTDISPYTDSVIPYVTGNAMVDYMPAGTLSYSLNTNNPPVAYDDIARNSWSLDKFDLGINLASSTYNVDFSITGGSNPSPDNYSANGGGSLNSGSVSEDFGFTHNNVNFNGTNCASCSLEVNGFLAGDSAQAAGVNFKVNTGGSSDGDIYGAAPLDYQSGNTGLGGNTNIGG